MRMWIIALMIGSLFLGCRQARPPQPEEDTATARAVIREIWQAARVYHWDKGTWPNTVDDLVKHHYIQIDSSVSEKWRFWLIDGPPLEIRAGSTEPFDEHRSERPKTVIYDVQKGQWSGYGVPHYGKERIAPPHRAELVGDVRKTIETIWTWTQIYYQDKGMWPETVAELERRSYVELDLGIAATWQFAIIGTPPQAVVAMSKGEMQDGGGRAVEYDITRDQWRGYGIE